MHFWSTDTVTTLRTTWLLITNMTFLGNYYQLIKSDRVWRFQPSFALQTKRKKGGHGKQRGGEK